MPLHEGRPVVTAAGVQLWHAVCYERRSIPLVKPSEVAPPTIAEWRLEPAHRVLGGIAGALVLVCGLAQWHWTARRTASDELPNLEDTIEEPVAARASITSREKLPPSPLRLQSEVAARYPVPALDGVPLDERFPSLANWIHPVSASLELVPTQSTRLFGVERKGVERAECGEGHCGVDLDGPRGRPLVAVADGIVVKIERRADGGDGRAGRFVRIRHDDGTFTNYMHMDDISSRLVHKGRIDAGTYLGTLGATAVYSAPPHLHFSLEIPRRATDHEGDHSNTRYVDPAPFLARSTIVPVPEKRDRDPLAAF